MTDGKDRERRGTSVLPVVRLNGGAYFIDLGYRQFREVMNPGSYVDFDSVKGREMCERAGVVTCTLRQANCRIVSSGAN